MIKKVALTTIFTIGILLQGCSHSKHNDNKQAQENSLIASNQYVLKSLNNQTYTIVNQANQYQLQNTKAKLVIIDLFATWCPPCRAEASRLAEIQALYPKAIKIIGLSVQRNITPSKLKLFRQNYGATYTLLYSNKNQELASMIAQTIPNLPANFPIPLMAIYKNGVLVKYFIGAAPQEMILSTIKTLLK